MMTAEEYEGLFDKEESCEQKGRKWTCRRLIGSERRFVSCSTMKGYKGYRLHSQLYFKFIEFISKQMNTKDGVFSVSFWPS